MKTTSILSFFFFCPILFGQTNPFNKVNDMSSNYSGTEYSDSNSQGSGFESGSNWTTTTTGFGATSINSDQNTLFSKSFYVTTGFWMANDDTVKISREFDDALVANDIFSINFASENPVESNSSFSIELHDSSDQKIISISYSYGDTNYTIFDGSNSDTGQSFTADTSKQLKIKYLGGNNYNYSIDNFTSSVITASSTLTDMKKVVINVDNLGYDNGFIQFGFDNIEVNASNISNGETVSVINSDVTLLDLTIDSGGTLIIESDGSLTVSDQLTNNGSVTLNSSSNEYSSLIASSITGSGTYTYNRYLSDTSTFDIISAPFTGQTFTDVLSNNSFIYSNPSDNTQYAYGPFNNNDGAYVQYDSDSDGNQTMDAGLGFRTGSFNSTGLIISEYGEGSGTGNKYLEIYNGTGSSVDLIDYAISKCTNGCNTQNVWDNPNVVTWVNSSVESRTISHGEVYVIASGHESASTEIVNNRDRSYGGLSNGDDVLALVQAGGDASSYTIIDIIGEMGDDPGTGWSVAGTSNATVDKTLVRKSTISSPNSSPGGSFGTNTTDSEWIVYAKDTHDYVGSHTSTAGETISFTGTFETSNVTEPITLGSDATYGRWNLIGNPFPSYLDLNDFFTNNTGNLESGTTNGVYAYDGDDSDGSVWTIYNGNNSSGQYIAPGQAFFVAASVSANVSFDTSWQSVSGGDDFLPGERRPNDDSFAQNASSSNSKISLALSFDDSKYAATDIYLNTKASSGLDVGYDAGTFANQAGSLGLYSFLADGSHPETKLAIQAVSNNISDPVVIPLGVNAQSGIDYTIKLKERPQQEGVFIYLKDKLDNSMTLLTDEDYSFNTSTDLQGDGRFEVHLSAFALSTFDISKAPYSMIGLSGKVQVTGELSKGDVITILDLRGRTLAKQTVNNPTQSTTVQLNGVSKGVYIGKVENNIGQYNTKFILK